MKNEGSERPEPEQVGGPIWWHSQVRYRFCQQLAPGKRVLDISCGNGLGTVLLSEVAESVIGVDASAEAVARAGQISSRENTRYVQVVRPPCPFEDGSFDLVVCLETIEHMAAVDQPAFVADLIRLLAPGGVLVVSTPHQASERAHALITKEPNPYHLHTPSAEELDRLLAPLRHRVELVQVDTIATSVVPADLAERERRMQAPLPFWASERPEHPISIVWVCARDAASLDPARAARPPVVFRQDHQRLTLMWQALHSFETPDPRGLSPADQFEILHARIRQLEQVVRGMTGELWGRVDALEAFLPWNRLRQAVRRRWGR